MKKRYSMEEVVDLKEKFCLSWKEIQVLLKFIDEKTEGDIYWEDKKTKERRLKVGLAGALLFIFSAKKNPGKLIDSKQLALAIDIKEQRAKSMISAAGQKLLKMKIILYNSFAVGYKIAQANECAEEIVKSQIRILGSSVNLMKRTAIALKETAEMEPDFVEILNMFSGLGGLYDDFVGTNRFCIDELSADARSTYDNINSQVTELTDEVKKKESEIIENALKVLLAEGKPVSSPVQYRDHQIGEIHDI